MSWGAVGASVGTSIVSGAISSSAADKAKKEQEEAAKKAEALINAAGTEAVYSGKASNEYLNAFLGIDEDKNFAKDAKMEAFNNPAFRKLHPAMQKIMLQRIEDAASKKQAAYDERMQGLRDSGYYGSGNRRFGMDDFEADPSYQFRMDEGIRGIDSSGAARGMQLSGATLKALNKYTQDLASTEYMNAYNRWNADNDRIFDRLTNTIDRGLNTEMTKTGWLTDNAYQMGNVNASNALAKGQIWSDTVSGIGGVLASEGDAIAKLFK